MNLYFAHYLYSMCHNNKITFFIKLFSFLIFKGRSSFYFFFSFFSFRHSFLCYIFLNDFYKKRFVGIFKKKGKDCIYLSSLCKIVISGYDTLSIEKIFKISINYRKIRSITLWFIQKYSIN